MANRDRSQGFAFVYVDLAKLLRDRTKISDDDHGPIYPVEEKTVNFNRDVIPQATTSPQTVQRTNAIGQIRENLDRLQNLHHKLHAMLEDLNTVADPKKKKN